MDRRGFLSAFAGLLTAPIIESNKRYFFFGNLWRPGAPKEIILHDGDSLEDAMLAIGDNGLIRLMSGIYKVREEAFLSGKKMLIIGEDRGLVIPGVVPGVNDGLSTVIIENPSFSRVRFTSEDGWSRPPKVTVHLGVDRIKIAGGLPG